MFQIKFLVIKQKMYLKELNFLKKMMKNQIGFPPKSCLDHFQKVKVA